MKTLFTTLGVMVVLGCGAAQDQSSGLGRLAQTQWLREEFPVSRVRIDVPGWASSVVDGKENWLLLAIPFTTKPISGDEFGVSVFIQKYPANLHRLTFPPIDKKPSSEKSINALHLKTAVIRGEHRVYVVKDVKIKNGIVLRCVAKIDNRIQNIDEYVKDIMRMVDSLDGIE